jgi:LacI family transcriptional regulator
MQEPMVTLKEIAKAVGVSSATVSRVLNFDSTLSVSPQTRAAVIETAEAMNYATPRNRNRVVQQGMSKIALVHFLRPDQELVDPYYVGLRLGIERRCADRKIEAVKVYHTDLMPDAALLQGAAGVIAIGRHEKDEIDWICSHNRNVVFADFSPADDEIDAVESDLVLAMRKLLAALVDLGYARIAFAGWVDANDRGALPGPEKRCRAFMDFMGEIGRFDPAICLTGTNTEDSGYRLTRELLTRADRPDALVTGNDNMAVGAYRAIHELGLRIPEDISVASFNDISVAQFLNPPLTTVRLPAEEIGEQAVDLLLERAAGREIAKRIRLASQVIWRGSSRVPAGAVVQRK